MKIEFTDRPYFLSHLRAPRGRGSWAFEIQGSGLPMLWSPSSLTYAEAKAWAKSTARDMQRAGTIPADVPYITLATQP